MILFENQTEITQQFELILFYKVKTVYREKQFIVYSNIKMNISKHFISNAVNFIVFK